MKGEVGANPASWCRCGVGPVRPRLHANVTTSRLRGASAHLKLELDRKRHMQEHLVPPAGIEPATPGSGNRPKACRAVSCHVRKRAAQSKVLSELSDAACSGVMGRDETSRQCGGNGWPGSANPAYGRPEARHDTRTTRCGSGGEGCASRHTLWTRPALSILSSWLPRSGSQMASQMLRGRATTEAHTIEGQTGLQALGNDSPQEGLTSGS